MAVFPEEVSQSEEEGVSEETLFRWLSGWLNGWLNGWVSGWLSGWLSG